MGRVVWQTARDDGERHFSVAHFYGSSLSPELQNTPPSTLIGTGVRFRVGVQRPDRDLPLAEEIGPEEPGASLCELTEWLVSELSAQAPADAVRVLSGGAAPLVVEHAATCETCGPLLHGWGPLLTLACAPPHLWGRAQAVLRKLESAPGDWVPSSVEAGLLHGIVKSYGDTSAAEVLARSIVKGTGAASGHIIYLGYAHNDSPGGFFGPSRLEAVLLVDDAPFPRCIRVNAEMLRQGEDVVPGGMLGRFGRADCPSSNPRRPRLVQVGQSTDWPGVYASVQSLIAAVSDPDLSTATRHAATISLTRTRASAPYLDALVAAGIEGGDMRLLAMIPLWSSGAQYAMMAHLRDEPFDCQCATCREMTARALGPESRKYTPMTHVMAEAIAAPDRLLDALRSGDLAARMRALSAVRSARRLLLKRMIGHPNFTTERPEETALLVLSFLEDDAWSAVLERVRSLWERGHAATTMLKDYVGSDALRALAARDPRIASVIRDLLPARQDSALIIYRHRGMPTNDAQPSFVAVLWDGDAPQAEFHPAFQVNDHRAAPGRWATRETGADSWRLIEHGGALPFEPEALLDTIVRTVLDPAATAHVRQETGRGLAWLAHLPDLFDPAALSIVHRQDDPLPLQVLLTLWAAERTIRDEAFALLAKPEIWQDGFAELAERALADPRTARLHWRLADLMGTARRRPAADAVEGILFSWDPRTRRGRFLTVPGDPEDVPAFLTIDRYDFGTILPPGIWAVAEHSLPGAIAYPMEEALERDPSATLGKLAAWLHQYLETRGMTAFPSVRDVADVIGAWEYSKWLRAGATDRTLTPLLRILLNAYATDVWKTYEPGPALEFEYSSARPAAAVLTGGTWTTPRTGSISSARRLPQPGRERTTERHTWKLAPRYIRSAAGFVLDQDGSLAETVYQAVRSLNDEDPARRRMAALTIRGAETFAAYLIDAFGGWSIGDTRRNDGDAAMKALVACSGSEGEFALLLDALGRAPLKDLAAPLVETFTAREMLPDRSDDVAQLALARHRILVLHKPLEPPDAGRLAFLVAIASASDAATADFAVRLLLASLKRGLGHYQVRRRGEMSQRQYLDFVREYLPSDVRVLPWVTLALVSGDAPTRASAMEQLRAYQAMPQDVGDYSDEAEEHQSELWRIYESIVLDGADAARGSRDTLLGEFGPMLQVAGPLLNQRAQHAAALLGAVFEATADDIVTAFLEDLANRVPDEARASCMESIARIGGSRSAELGRILLSRQDWASLTAYALGVDGLVRRCEGSDVLRALCTLDTPEATRCRVRAWGILRAVANDNRPARRLDDVSRRWLLEWSIEMLATDRLAMLQTDPYWHSLRCAGQVALRLGVEGIPEVVAALIRPMPQETAFALLRQLETSDAAKAWLKSDAGKAALQPLASTLQRMTREDAPTLGPYAFRLLCYVIGMDPATPGIRCFTADGRGDAWMVDSARRLLVGAIEPDADIEMGLNAVVLEAVRDVATEPGARGCQDLAVRDLERLLPTTEFVHLAGELLADEGVAGQTVRAILRGRSTGATACMGDRDIVTTLECFAERDDPVGMDARSALQAWGYADE